MSEMLAFLSGGMFLLGTQQQSTLLCVFSCIVFVGGVAWRTR